MNVIMNRICPSAQEGDKWSASRSGRFTSGKELGYPLHRRLGGPQSRCGRVEEEKNTQPLPGLEPPA